MSNGADYPPFVAALVESHHGDNWAYMRFDCRDPRVLRDDVLERLWDNPEDEAFDDQH